MAMGLAIEMVVTTLVGVGIGWLLGSWLGALPFFVVMGALLGGVGGMMRLQRVWKRHNGDD